MQTTREILHDWTFPGARGVVAVVHGYAEHGARYAHVAATLREHGIATIARDLRGHGNAPGRRGHVASFADYHADVHHLLDAANKRCPGLPIYVLAHSMGGLILLDLLASGARLDVAGAIITSPLLGLARPPGALSRWFVSLLARLWPGCRLPSGLDPRHVCRDPDLSREYAADPQIFRHTTARWFAEAMRAIERVHAVRTPFALPLLLLVAGDDRIVSTAATRRFAKEHGLSDCLEEFSASFHELLNEPPSERARVLDRIVHRIDTAETWR